MFLKHFSVLFLAFALMLNPHSSLLPQALSTAEASAAEKSKPSAQNKAKKKSDKKQKRKKQKAKKSAKKSKEKQRSRAKANTPATDSFDIRPDADSPSMPANDPLDDAAAELPEAKDTL